MLLGLFTSVSPQTIEKRLDQLQSLRSSISDTIQKELGARASAIEELKKDISYLGELRNRLS